jgi:hypothetical protein
MIKACITLHELYGYVIEPAYVFHGDVIYFMHFAKNYKKCDDIRKLRLLSSVILPWALVCSKNLASE